MEHSLNLLLAYKYLILLPLAIVEGPIITVVAGFLVTLGKMDIFVVYAIAVLGDFIGDTVLYGLGRFGNNFVYTYGHYIGAGHEEIEKAKIFFAEKHNKAIVMSKIFHGVGASGLVAAGVLAIPYPRYMRTCFYIALAQAAVFLFIGIVFGHAYAKIASYLDLYAEGIVIVVAILLVITVVYKLFKK